MDQNILIRIFLIVILLFFFIVPCSIVLFGKLLTPEKVAVALGLGADFVNIARGLMFSVGCIQEQVCHTNNCPVGVATTDSKLQKDLIIEEKSYRVCNYILSLREGLFFLAVSVGIDTPTKFTRDRIIYKDQNGRMIPVEDDMEFIAVFTALQYRSLTWMLIFSALSIIYSIDEFL